MALDTPTHCQHQTPPKRSQSIDRLDTDFSSIRIQKTQNRSSQCQMDSDIEMDQDDDDDDGFLNSMEEMSDGEFFGKLDTEDRSIQTKPVLMFKEEDIPKIRYNGKLLADCDEDTLSRSAINYNDFEHHRKVEPLNTSRTSSKSVPQSDKIMFSMQSDGVPPWYNQKAPLRHNKDAILCDSVMDSDSDYNPSDIENSFRGNSSDSDRAMPSPLTLSKSAEYTKSRGRGLKQKDRPRIKQRPQRRVAKRESDGNRMLREYKTSKLAKNANWSICNAY